MAKQKQVETQKLRPGVPFKVAPKLENGVDVGVLGVQDNKGQWVSGLIFPNLDSSDRHAHLASRVVELLNE